MAGKRAATAYNVTPVWEPVSVLPSQVTQYSGQRRSPELRLVAAILEDALQCVTRRAGARRDSRRRREFMDAWNWVWDDRRDWPFAFKNVCDLLALDAAAVRYRVRCAAAAQAAVPSSLQACQQQ